MGMKFLKTSVVLSAFFLISGTATVAQVDPDKPTTQSVQDTGTATLSGFQANELPARLSTKIKFKDAADKVVVDCAAQKFDAAMEDAKSFAQMAKPKKAEIESLLAAASSLQTTNKPRAVALHLMAYQSLRVDSRTTANDSIASLFNIARVVASRKPTELERQFATGLLEQGLQTRRLAGSIQQSDAPFILLRARLEFSLKHWDNAIKEYEFWLGMYAAKGQDPPANDLPDALGELGIAYTSLKNLPKAEEYFTRACAAANALNGTTVTPLSQYDVEDFLIFNLLNQNRLDHAKELAQQHLKFKETTLGLRSPQLAEELNRYADLFEQAGETSFSFSLRARAGRVVSP